ncbi:phage portal protein, lambda family [Loktanella atrilutea]|uniref:Phage portal protein, lambda family n=1 Tax=Loktanella atrilutea TaxID=366533 RepID=A0A1M4WC61_LOKAT|nr:phage portal protein [Loktanella atrilutea]SHE78858.1 phage portal protein, lambda family [Loktanella atrilutea]
MSLVDRLKGLMGGQATPAPGGDLATSNARRPTSAYMRGGRGISFQNWFPAMRRSQDEIGVSWQAATARAVDAIHNSGWLAGAIDQAVANTVGTGLRLKPQPETELIGMSKDEARDWNKLVERRWDLWAGNPMECDIEGRRTFGEMQAAAFQHWLATGEILAEVAWKKRPWSNTGTKFRLMSPTRLSRRSSGPDRLVNGVFLDIDGFALGFEIKPHRDEAANIYGQRINALGAYGRPRMVHVFNGPPETCRGITPLAPALQVIRQFDELSDATLAAAIVQTLFAATITSEGTTEEAIEGLLTPRERAEMVRDGVSPMTAYLEMAADFYGDGAMFDNRLNGRVAHLFPEQKLEFHTAEHPSGNYPEFSKMLLREIARCLGLIYESYSGDYSASSYASLNRASAEMFEITKARRRFIVAPASQPFYEAWLEEEIERGTIPFPGGIVGFLNNRLAATRALWRGGAKPIGEEVKLSKAHSTWLGMGVLSEQMICAELGHDYEDVLADRAEAMALRAEYNLPEPVLMGVGGGATSATAEDNGEDDNAH